MQNQQNVNYLKQKQIRSFKINVFFIYLFILLFSTVLNKIFDIKDAYIKSKRENFPVQKFTYP